MSTLHIISRNNEMQTQLIECLKVASPGDAIILIEQGVYASQNAELCNKCLLSDISLYALLHDMELRGLRIDPGSKVSLINDHAFVELCCHHDKSISWF